eukprot:CAMPEP_0181307198 /NCGR_PEP_ID=MMETSP1101-20121128/10741_1 /TAXON_ID=46948 /ORGANISM="Rhodomonas abbreviata, Strain Caron Lab Isolate" /LENGTH=187 /DNA_ID=CAMNT_0023413377 /DNA_START=91 /DNA_END=650 /DNA_ORIENTATION=+
MSAKKRASNVQASAAADVVEDPDVPMNEELVLFHKGWPSQWFPSRFYDENGLMFNCCEQYMMYHKARLFGDNVIMAEIMKSKDPKKQKALGRAVANFDADVWDKACDAVVTEGNRLKFEQNEPLRRLLLATGERVLAEASPFDKIWGIGLAASQPWAWDQRCWKGSNRLGLALMRVRAALAQGGEGA